MREALIESALESAAQAEALGLPTNQIVISCKVSAVQDLIMVYQDLAKRCQYPLHLGLTEAGMGSKGIVASTAAIAILLQQGIGDTIRVSLTPEPNESRTREVVVAQEILHHGDTLLYPIGNSMSWLWSHHIHFLPRVGSANSTLFARPNANLAG